MTARATARARRSSPKWKKMSASSASEARVDEVGGAVAVALHAHVERPVVAEGEAALGLVELHRGDADVEHDAVDAVGSPRSATIASRSPKRPGTSTSRPFAFATSAGAAGDRVRVAVDRDDAGRGGSRRGCLACSRRRRRCRRRRRRRARRRARRAPPPGAPARGAPARPRPASRHAPSSRRSGRRPARSSRRARISSGPAPSPAPPPGARESAPAPRSGTCARARRRRPHRRCRHGP